MRATSMTDTEFAWERLKAHELRALAGGDTVVIIPVAAVEQHGPHLATGTDAIIGREVAIRAARKAAAVRRAVVTPVLWCGLSEHHMAFGGTLTLTPATFQAMLRDVTTALVRQGFDKVLISNSHGGNHIAIQAAAEALAIELPVIVAATTYFREAPDALGALLDDQPGVLHACEAETSMMLALAPDLVDTTDLPGAASPQEVPVGAGNASYRWRPFQHVSANGVIGDPSRASAAKGERLLEAASDAVAALITDPAVWDPAMDVRR